ncbi:hypothetical protein HQN89_10825 [Paenibacillus frigoriresistens]|uniref:hypothetical protein n=1 Tax=Paenibacillus alginolyticus TaxID=59839 RepID=UPI001567587D|nr:hypothetical protein [Paenibacillus frigoriresistens]NRF91512.1 hypothetical protein [Paenibacillus frigoriresistens]
MTSTKPTEVESFLIHEYVMLPLLIKVVESNLAKLKAERRPLQELYIGVTNVMIDKINADLTEVRKSLRELNIKVWEDKSKNGAGNAIHYRYACRGYEHELALIREQAKAELGVRLGKYAQKMEDAAKNITDK